jgi:hypothetical protein
VASGYFRPVGRCGPRTARGGALAWPSSAHHGRSAYKREERGRPTQIPLPGTVCRLYLGERSATAGRSKFHGCRSVFLRCSSVAPSFFSWCVVLSPPVRQLASAAGCWLVVSCQRRRAPAQQGSSCRAGSLGGDRRSQRDQIDWVRLR